MGQGLHTKMVQVSSQGTVGVLLGTVVSVWGKMLWETERWDIPEAEAGLGCGPGSAAHLHVILGKFSPYLTLVSWSMQMDQTGDLWGHSRYNIPRLFDCV